ncbi:MAG: HAMP domain-containing histidine kinase [Clostridia bacterium]|nr:HAMP domain-containing histidine kinase [Clostridia bacterium]
MFNKTKRKIVAAIVLSLAILFSATLAVIYLSSYYDQKTDDREMLERYAENYNYNEKDDAIFTPGEESVPFMPGMDTAPDGFTPGKESGGFSVPPSGENNGDFSMPPSNGNSGDGSKEFTTRPDDGSFPGGKQPDMPNGARDMPERDEREFRASTFFSVALSKDGEVLSVDAGQSGIKSEDELVEDAKSAIERGKESGKINGSMYLVTDKGDYTLVTFMDSTKSDNNMSRLLKNALIVGGAAIIVLFFASLLIAKKIVKPLEENDRRQKQFVSDAGHELKTPISVISANCELLSKESGDNEWISNIQYENERMASLVTELLDLSHAENAGMQMAETDLSRLVAGAALPHDAAAFDAGYIINTDIEDGVRVVGNGAKLAQLVSILLDNAIKHSSGGNEITLSLKTSHKYAALSVENSADEIPEEKMAHLFERFYRADDARGGDEGHYGLGLAIAKAIVDSHKGEITAKYADGKICVAASIPLAK